MIDYIKILLLYCDIHALENNCLLDFEQRNISEYGVLLPKVDKQGNLMYDKKGEIIYKTPFRIAHYKGLDFIIWQTGTVNIKGSIHKYWNSGTHNYNDFDINAINWVLIDLKDRFNILPQNCVLRSLELGVNIIPHIITNLIIDSCLLHKTKRFEDKFNSDEGKYKQCKHKEYIVKLYNKRLHYEKQGFKMNNEILRFELKFTKMTYLHQLNIFTLKELLDYRLINFKERIIKEWNNILFFDENTIKNELSRLKYGNHLEWDKLHKRDRNLFNYHRNQLNRMLKENPENHKFKIEQNLSEKLELLNSKTTQIDNLSIRSKRAVLIS